MLSHKSYGLAWIWWN